MAYAFIDQVDATNTANGLTLTQARTYGAGERVLIWLRWVTVGGVTPSVSDGTNTYTQIGTTLVDANTSGSYAVFECLNTAAGTVTVTFTLTSPGASFRTMLIARYSGLDTTASGAQARAAQAAPGTGTDALSSGNVTVASQPALLFGISYDDSGANAITAGTGFTSRGTCANQDAAFGTASRIEDKRLTSTTAVPATFTASGGTDNYVTFGVVVPEAAGGGGGGATASGTELELRPNRQRPGRGPHSLGRYFRSIGSMGATPLSTITGTSATTNANDTSAASGTTTIVGTLARTNANDTSSASGTTTVVGTSATTNANDTSSASGAVGSGSSGTVAYTNANDTSAASGTTTVTGTLAKTNANDSASAAGFAGSVTGTVAATNADDSASAEGTTPRVNSGIPPRFKPVIWVRLKVDDEEVTVAEDEASEAAAKLAQKAVKRITRTASAQTPAITVEGPVSRETKREIRSAFRAEFNRDAGVIAAKALIRAQQEQEDEETLLWLI